MRKGEQNIYFFPHIPITNLCKYYQTSEFIKIGIKQVKPQLFSLFVFITTKNMQFYILIRHCKSSLLSPAKVIRKKSRGKVQEFLRTQQPGRKEGRSTALFWWWSSLRLTKVRRQNIQVWDSQLVPLPQQTCTSCTHTAWRIQSTCWSLPNLTQWFSLWTVFHVLWKRQGLYRVIFLTGPTLKLRWLVQLLYLLKSFSGPQTGPT